MNILYINDNDLAGRRFNGYDLQLFLNKTKEYSAKQVVASKASKDKNVIPLIDNNGANDIRNKCKDFENRISMQSVIYPFGEKISHMQEFKDADIVHYHLLFNHFMSIYSFKKLVQLKPSVWTLHDPWALTGHCVHPIDCNGWLTGCKNCPYLDRYSPLREDNASSIWNIKKRIYEEISIDIVVASKWMYDRVKKSPLTSCFKNIHLIPFGIDLNVFKQRTNRVEIRKELGIKNEDFVIMFRQDDQEYKGLRYIKEMLNKLDVERNIIILTVGKVGLLKEVKKKYQIIEFEWINNSSKMADLYSAADLFLMPSTAESFGLMAVEAMACSLPVIVSQGTALETVCNSPEYGISIKLGNSEKFSNVVTKLVEDSEECLKRGDLGRELVEREYSIDRFYTKITSLYDEIYKRKRKNNFIWTANVKKQK